MSCGQLWFNEIGSGYSTSSSEVGNKFHRLCMCAGGYEINTAKTTCTERWRIIAPTDNNGVCSAIGTGWGVPGGETLGDYPEKLALCNKGFAALGVSSASPKLTRETEAPTGCTGYCSGSGSSMSCGQLWFNEIGSGYSTSSSEVGNKFHRLCRHS